MFCVRIFGTVGLGVGERVAEEGSVYSLGDDERIDPLDKFEDPPSSAGTKTTAAG